MALKKLHKEILIKASPEKVWDTTFEKDTYKEWTRPFSPDPRFDSRFEGGWKKGDKVKFIGTGENGDVGGMVSEIAESDKAKFLSIRHLGIIKPDGTEDTTSDEAKKWAPAYENYTFKETEDGTKFIVDVEVEESMADFFEDLWPKALAKLKEISER